MITGEFVKAHASSNLVVGIHARNKQIVLQVQLHTLSTFGWLLELDEFEEVLRKRTELYAARHEIVERVAWLVGEESQSTRREASLYTIRECEYID